MKAFFKTLVEPKKIIFINSGVKLTIEGSEVIEEIKELEKRGVEALSCGTCLDFYGLKEKLQVGVISNTGSCPNPFSLSPKRFVLPLK